MANKECTRVAHRAFAEGKSLGRNRVFFAFFKRSIRIEFIASILQLEMRP